MKLIISTTKDTETKTWFKFPINRFIVRFVTIDISFKSHIVKIKRRQLLPLFDSIRDYVVKNGSWSVAEIYDHDGELVEVKIVQ